MRSIELNDGLRVKPELDATEFCVEDFADLWTLNATNLCLWETAGPAPPTTPRRAATAEVSAAASVATLHLGGDADEELALLRREVSPNLLKSLA